MGSHLLPALEADPTGELLWIAQQAADTVLRRRRGFSSVLFHSEKVGGRTEYSDALIKYGRNGTIDRPDMDRPGRTPTSSPRDGREHGRPVQGRPVRPGDVLGARPPRPTDVADQPTRLEGPRRRRPEEPPKIPPIHGTNRRNRNGSHRPAPALPPVVATRPGRSPSPRSRPVTPTTSTGRRSSAPSGGWRAERRSVHDPVQNVGPGRTHPARSAAVTVPRSTCASARRSIPTSTSTRSCWVARLGRGTVPAPDGATVFATRIGDDPGEPLTPTGEYVDVRGARP